MTRFCQFLVLLSVLLSSTSLKAQGPCAPFFIENFESSTNGSTTNYPFTTTATYQTTGNPINHLSPGGVYQITSGHSIPGYTTYNTKNMVYKGLDACWQKNFQIDPTRTVIFRFEFHNLSPANTNLLMLAAIENYSGNSYVQVSSTTGANVSNYVELYMPANSLNQSSNLFKIKAANYSGQGYPVVLIDNISISYANATVSNDVNRSFCGYGLQTIMGPGTGAFKWYKVNNGVVTDLNYIGQSYTDNLTRRITEYRVATLDPLSNYGYGQTGYCQSAQSKVTAIVSGSIVEASSSSFNSLPGPDHWFTTAQLTNPTSPYYFKTDYTGHNEQYGPCNGPGIGEGHFGIGEDPRANNCAWTFFGSPDRGKFMSIDGDNYTSASAPRRVWGKELAARAGYKYILKLKIRNAFSPAYPGAGYYDPLCPVVTVDQGNTILSTATIVDDSDNPIQNPNSAFVISPSTDWQTIQYALDIPAGVSNPTISVRPAPLPSPHAGNDFLLDDIEVWVYNSVVAPQVAGGHICGSGTTTLQVQATADQLVNSTYVWYNPDGSVAHTGPQFTPSLTYNSSNQSANSVTYSVRDLTISNCPSQPAYVTVNVYNTTASYTIDMDEDNASGPPPYFKNQTIVFEAAGSGDRVSTTQYEWYWSDRPTQPTITSSPRFARAFTKAGTYTVRLLVRERHTGTNWECVNEVTGSLVIHEPLCEMNVPLTAGTVTKDWRTGAIVFKSDQDCIPDGGFECLGLQPRLRSNAVAATATAFTDTLVQASSEYGIDANETNPFLQGKERLMPYGSYTQRRPLDVGSANYNAGTFQLWPFNWQLSARAHPESWMTEAVTEQVDPNGEVLQERDPLGMHSTAKFGYGSNVASSNGISTHLLPYLQAHNADYGAVLFESFENVYTQTNPTSTTYGEDKFVLVSNEVQHQRLTPLTPVGTSVSVHTGTGSILLKQQGNNRILTLKPVQITDQVIRTGLVMKCWVDIAGLTQAQTASLQKHFLLINPATGNSIPGASVELEEVANTGTWRLFQAVVPAGTVAAAKAATNAALLQGRLLFEVPAGSPQPNISLDDLRLQPLTAQMVTYVYDQQTFRLLASFDDQHFALLYQYNDEGKLVRKQVETEHGVKTIQETQYNIAKP